MDVRCEKCSTEYEFDEERVGANGVTVKCTACGYVFKVRRPRKALPPRATTTLGKGPQGREWLVRKPDGQMIAFRELTTLQKWIVEGRIARDDEISKNGETWKRLGNILELEPFFSVYEKAKALNELIERGGAEGSPVTLRGSEVLATMNPLSSLPLDEAGQSLPPGRGPTITGDLSRASALPARASTNALSMTPIPLGAPPPLPGA
ncbi:zinc-ribbon domain-containing protein, partial [Myxococcota bacterium]|nr:zinc-ribbon domain-containing protein [Myxococcota bacterium]